LGLLDYKARFYDPVIGRFLQPDSVIPGATNPQAWNRYSYVLNNPVNHSDPSGHCAEPLTFTLCVLAIGAGVGAIVSMVQQYHDTGHVDIGKVGQAALTGAGVAVVAVVAVATIAAAAGGAAVGEAACADGDCTNEAVALGTIADDAAFGANQESAILDDLSGINPTRSQTNCLLCSIATDKTRGGVPTVAGDMNGSSLKQGIDELSKHYDPAEVEAAFSSSISSRPQITGIMEEAGDGARGIVRGYGTIFGGPGHYFNVENIGGVIKYFDGQGPRFVEDHWLRYNLLRTN
jgi:hypothetical protein